MASTLPAHARVARSRPAVPRRLLMLRGDEALVAQLRRGEEVAFEILFDRYSDKILSFCRHMLGSREAAEDAAQQAFASAYADLVDNDREIRFKPWLYTIARNRCLSMLRAAREEPVAELEAETVGLQEQVQQRADLRALVADLRDLPEDQRAALVLAEIGDLSHAEIGAILDLEAHKVKGLVFRARSGLIERRDARDQPCEQIRERLANLRGGALRSGDLRHHLKACSGCRDYLADVRRQRRMLAAVLPVIPTAGFKNTALAATGIGAGGTGGGLVAGGFALSATAAKVAAVAVVATGAGVAAERAIDAPASDNASPVAVQAAGNTPAAEAPRGLSLGLDRALIDIRKTAKSQGKGKDRSTGLNPAGRERGKSQHAPGRTREGTGRESAPGRTGTAPGKNGTAPGQVNRTQPTKPVTPQKPVTPTPQAQPKPAPLPVQPPQAPVAPQDGGKGKLK